MPGPGPGSRFAGRQRNPAFGAGASVETSVALPSKPYRTSESARMQGGAGAVDGMDSTVVHVPGGRQEMGLAARLRSARETGKLDLRASGQRLAVLDKAFMELIEDGGSSGGEWWLSVNLEELLLGGIGLERIQDDVLEECSETVKVVMLDDNKLKEFPSALACLAGLKKLVLAGNPIQQLPIDVWFPELVVLSLHHTMLKQVDGFLSGCLALNVLDLSHCQMHDLDRCELPPCLQVLKLSKNRLDKLPDTIFSQVGASLVELDLSHNNLRTLPPSISNLSALQQLDVRHNQLSKLTQMPRHGALDQLLLGFNRLEALDGIGLEALPNLSTIDVSENRLTALPANELIAMPNLRILDCSNNAISEIPHSLGYISNLQGLNVLGNPVRGIRYSILQSGTTKLKAYLRTRGAPPSGLPDPEEKRATSSATTSSRTPLQNLLVSDDRIRDALAGQRHNGTLTLNGLLSSGSQGLEQLDLLLEACGEPALQQQEQGAQLWHTSRSVASPVGNRILAKLELAAMGYRETPRLFAAVDDRCSRNPQAVAAAIGSLRSLDLSDNALRSVNGTDLAALPDLRELFLRKNSLTEFDPVTGLQPALSKLVVLDVRQNQLKQLPQGLGNACPLLEELFAGFNPICGSDASLSRCSNLRTLDVSNCRLDSFPDAVLGLHHLEYVNVENNAIPLIPLELARCQNLKTLLIAGNPQRGVRPNVVAEGSVAVLNLIKQRFQGSLPGTKPNNYCDTMDSARSADSGRTLSSAPAESSAFEPTVQQQELKQPPPSRQEPAASSSAELKSRQDLLQDLEKASETIQTIEQEIESNFSLSNMQRHALKKQLARERAARIRLERQLP